MDHDAKMTKIIKDKLEEKMGASAMDINVEYQNGFVHLSGFVDVLAEKTFAEEILKTFDGIRKIENNITICMDGEISDSHITAEIDRKLRNSKYAGSLRRVSAKVSGGAATLVGSVNTLADELHAIEVARSARGVKNVVSHLDILSSHRYDDITLKNRLNQVFANVHDVEASVSNGRVILRGFVENMHDMEAAVELASEVEGVTHVTNKLKMWNRDEEE